MVNKRQTPPSQEPTFTLLDKQGNLKPNVQDILHDVYWQDEVACGLAHDARGFALLADSLIERK